MNSLTSTLFFIVIALSMGELLLAWLWVPAYYRFGIPMYQVSFKLSEAPADMSALIPKLESALPRTMWNRAVIFRSLDVQELAFRNQLGSRNAPVHGRIHFDPYNYELVITGYFYWAMLLLPLLFIGFFLSDGFFLLMGAFFVLVLGLNIVMLRSSYGRISNVVQEIFKVQHEHNLEDSR